MMITKEFTLYDKSFVHSGLIKAKLDNLFVPIESTRLHPDF